MERERGLKSVALMREERKARKFGKPGPGFFLFIGGGVLLVLLVAYLTSNRELETAREDLLKKQRAAAATVGKEWTPLRDTLESIALENARDPYAGDVVKKDVPSWDFRALSGIYLRLRTAQAKDVATLRAAAADSQKDSFVACLLKGTPAKPDAGPGDERPWNLRQAYGATRVLDEAWVAEVKAAENEMRVRVFQQQYDKAQMGEIPLAVTIVKGAEFFLLVLDEDTDEAKAQADGGVPSHEELQALPHPARVVVVHLKTKEVLLRLRRSAEGQFFMAGEHGMTDPETRAAMKRQVNNCALAQAVTAEIGK